MILQTQTPVLLAPSQRLRDWQLRYAVLVRARMSAPMVWGQHDCCLWAADCVQAITGVDPAQQLRGLYSTERDARRLMAQLGGMAAIATAALGKPVFACMASVGDIVLVTQAQQTLLAVCNGGTLLVVGQDGLQTQFMPLQCKAWKV